jgi:cytochrome c5
MRNVIMSSIVLFSLTNVALAGDDRYKDFDDAHLIAGKKIWMGTCEGCHGWGVGDAPIPLNYDEWGFRIEKGKEVLYEHAINGFFGPDDTMMPEKGGNPELSDDEVKSAVDYMVELAKSHKP